MKVTRFAKLETIVTGVLMLGALVVVISVLAKGNSSPAQKIADAQSIVGQIVRANWGYHYEYGKMPQGDTQALLRILDGNNPRHIVFLDIRPKDMKDGLYLDPWGTPYAIDLSDPEHPKAASFGPNKLDNHGRGDDIVSGK